ncbi:DMT family transporter [Brucellaceae bacterium C25G]
MSHNNQQVIETDASSATGIENSGGQTERNHKIGIALLIGATIIFAMQDAITKHLVADYPITFIIMVRYWVFFAVGTIMASRAESGFKQTLKTKKPFIQLARGLILVFEIAMVGLAFKTMGLAEVIALFQSYPLFVTALAAIFLGEKVGWRRWLALTIGFGGILVILRPGSGVMEFGAIYTVLAAIAYALYQILTRVSGNSDSAVTSFFYVGAVGAGLMTLGLPFFWISMAPVDLIWLGVLCIMAMTAHFFLIKALSLAPATLLQPFNYLQLVWSVIVGWIVFRDMPDMWTFIGGFIVVGSGLFVFYREQKLAAERKKQLLKENAI